jgi:sugar fermentation stimulation protein A
MEELLIPGVTRGYVVPGIGPGRSTRYDLVSVRHGRTLVSIDTRVGNRIVADVLARSPPSGLEGGGWRAEVRFGPHRFDFARVDGSSGRPTELLEVKTSNLRVGRTAMFPDAPTERGTRHLRALAEARRSGIPARVLFAIQRDDVSELAPNRALDPEFALAFDRALDAGVVITAHRLRVEPQGVRWGPAVPVRRSAEPERIK